MLTKGNQVFYPHDGRLAAPSEENLAKVGDRTFKQSLPFMNNTEIVYQDSQDHDYTARNIFHPVSRTSDHYMLSDSFQKYNLSAEEDKLRPHSENTSARGHTGTITFLAYQFYLAWRCSPKIVYVTVKIGPNEAELQL